MDDEALQTVQSQVKNLVDEGYEAALLVPYSPSQVFFHSPHIHYLLVKIDTSSRSRTKMSRTAFRATSSTTPRFSYAIKPMISNNPVS